MLRSWSTTTLALVVDSQTSGSKRSISTGQRAQARPGEQLLAGPGRLPRNRCPRGVLSVAAGEAVLLEVAFDLLEAAALGLGHQRLDEQQREQSHPGVAEKYRSGTERGQQDRERL